MASLGGGRKTSVEIVQLITLITHEMRNEITSKRADKEDEEGWSVHCLSMAYFMHIYLRRYV